MKEFLKENWKPLLGVSIWIFIAASVFTEYFKNGEYYKLLSGLLVFLILTYIMIMRMLLQVNPKLLNLVGVVLTVAALIEIAYACYFRQNKLKFDLGACATLVLALNIFWIIKALTAKEQASISSEQ